MSSHRHNIKGFKFDEILYIFGGDHTDLIEKFNIKNWEWGDLSLK